ncbi:MAG: hypothetical protein KGI04_03400 [Candidatus Micrarchaeota archaeon]|nr:hypothetical protein [Candidatus Micrarchaeota archaeon]
MPIGIFATKHPVAPQKWRESAEVVTDALVKYGSAQKSDIRMCPAFEQLKRPGEVAIELGWFTGRTETQKTAVKETAMRGLSETLGCASSEIRFEIIDGDEGGWIIRKELPEGQLAASAPVEVPLVLVVTKQIPETIKQRSVAETIVQTLAAVPGIKKEDVEVCPGYGQLRAGSDSKVRIDIAMFTGRDSDKKVFIKKRIVDDVSSILSVRAADMEANVFEGDSQSWAVKGEILSKRE